MRAFLAPSICLSIARRSSRVFSQVSVTSTNTRWAGRSRTVSCGTVSMVSVGEDAAATSVRWPLGLDPERCKVVDIRREIRGRGYTPPSKGRTKAALLGELQGLARAESLAPPDPVSSDSTSVAADSGNKERQRWNPEAGWVDRSSMQRGDNGYPLCRFCKVEVPSPRRTFCSNGCVHEHRIRTQGTYVRKCLLTRDSGKCAECGIDAAGLYRRARAAWTGGVSVAAKRRAVALEMVGTPFEGKVPSPGATRRPTQGKFWHADHIIPVVRGGGQCSLKNYRTLCVPCHAAATKRLAIERAAARAAQAAGANVGTPPATLAEVAGTVKRKRGRPRKINREGSSSSSSSSSNESSSPSRKRSGDNSRTSLAEAFASEGHREETANSAPRLEHQVRLLSDSDEEKPGPGERAEEDEQHACASSSVALGGAPTGCTC